MEIPKGLVDKITEDVLKKKELQNIYKNFVKKIIKEQIKDEKLKKFLIMHEEKTLHRSEKYKKLIKKIRAILRKSYSMFVKKKVEELISKIKKDKEQGIKEALNAHLSTKERLPFYKKIYKRIWKITGKPKSILDLGSGYNPLSFKYMDLNKVKYFAVELNKIDCKLINEYFKKEKRINGKTIQMDLQEEKNFKKLPKTDICFMLKLLDTIDKKGHKTSKKLIESVNCKWVVISFPLRTIGQRKMKGKEKRGKWLEKYLDEKRKEYVKFEMGDELFYVIKNA